MRIWKKKVSEEDYYLASQWTLMGRKLMKHKLAKISMWILAILYLVALFGNFIAPYGLEDYDSNYKNMAPTKIHLFNDGKFIGPHIYGTEYINNRETFKREWVENKEDVHKIEMFVHGTKYKLFGLIESDLHLFGINSEKDEKQVKVMLFGGDSLGNDLFSRVILGSQISLTIPFAGTFISFILGIVLGGLSGYFGGLIDTIVQRIIEVLSSLPTIPLWMALSAALPPDWSPVKVYLGITVILSLIGWTSLGRQVRGLVLSIKNEDFVVAARLAGTSEPKIILTHLIPSFMSHIIASITLSIPNMILSETSLSFLGIGLRPPVISWGTLLQQAQNVHSIVMAPWLLIPGLFVIIFVLVFNFLGDGLRDAADPYGQ